MLHTVTEAGRTTVGTAVRVEHRHATPVGEAVEVTAEPAAGTAGRRLTFAVRAVDRARFLERL